ncbi:hypothetical protein LPTSP4_22690 [Leptospira ryugenii]|uniref:Uncharacterized protein n=1 Tax=Leptospira ryugenii TaxID=1917863 RepID=A0A2P2E1I8_9LEPT|nr:hypothetical protein LPTSP4_22690 [Leptospira ryugenii]
MAIASKEAQFNEKVVAFIIKENGHRVLTGYEMPIHKKLKKFSKFDEKNEG